MRKGYQSSRACSLCRQKRTKCSGTQPCIRCVAHHKDCTYSHLVHESKAHLRDTLKELQNSRHESQLIFDILRAGGNASNAILQALQQNVTLADIATALSDPDWTWVNHNDADLDLSTFSINRKQLINQSSSYSSPSELDNVATTTIAGDSSPDVSIVSSATKDLSCMLPLVSLSSASGLPPAMSLVGEVFNQIPLGYGNIYDGGVYRDDISMPMSGGQAYSDTQGLTAMYYVPSTQWESPYGFVPLACGDSVGIRK